MPAPAPSPDQEFGLGAGADLAPVAQEMEAVKRIAGGGSLRIDSEVARQLLESLDDILNKLDELINAKNQLDLPLRLGDNWIARAMSQRLQSAAAGDRSAAIWVLRRFRDVIEDYRLTVQAAMGRYVTIEEDTEEAFKEIEKEHSGGSSE